MISSPVRISKKIVVLFLTLAMVACSGGGGGGGGGSGSDSASDEGDSSAGDFSLAKCATADPGQDTLSNLRKLFSSFQNSKLASKLSTSAKSEIIDVPVVFHVISKGPAFEDGEVPDEMLIEQVDILNRAFSGEAGGVATPFRFSLVGINRVRKPEWHLMNPGSDAELDAKTALRSGGKTTLNFFIGDIEGKILGFTLLPVFATLLESYDGVVLNFRSLPGSSYKRYNLGNTAVHEVGHWLGLMHTFQGECDPLIGDLVSDTPLEKQPASGEYCPANRDSCPDSEGIDPIHNHMTYTEDSCRNEFTAGQVDFMLFSYSILRVL